jgi:hypothetical protein
VNRGTIQSFIPMSRSLTTNTGVWNRSARSNATGAISKHSFGSLG